MATKKLKVRVHPAAADTFRRAGLVFTREATTYDVTPEQEAAILNEPLLIIESGGKKATEE